MEYSEKQRQILGELRIAGRTALAEAEKLRSMELFEDEAIWLLVLGSTIRAIQDLRNHQFVRQGA